MAAQEYYNSFNEDTQAPPYPPPQYRPVATTPPYPTHQTPQFNPADQKPDYQHQQIQPYNPRPAPQVQIHQQPHAPYYPPQNPQYLQPPQVRPPPQVRFDDEIDSDDSDIGRRRSNSEPPRRHRHHHHHHSRDSSRDSSRSHRSRDRSIDRDRSADRDRGHDRDGDRPRAKRDHSSTNTFLGAFGGSVIGDAILPGLGTLGGLVLGGIGGHEASRSKSARPSEKRRYHSHSHRDTYDEEYEAGRRRRGEID